MDVFWFFFSKKNALLAFYPARHDSPPSTGRQTPVI